MSYLLVAEHVQPLEARRLLSLTPFGPETVVPVDNRLANHSSALAVAGDGSFLVASHDVGRAGLTVVRYSAAGQQVGSPIVLGLPAPLAAFAFDGFLGIASFSGTRLGSFVFDTFLLLFLFDMSRSPSAAFRLARPRHMCP